MNLGAPRPGDERKIECLVSGGLSLFGGAQVAVDATLVRPLTREGKPIPKATWQNGAALEAAEKRKREQTYPEFFSAERCRLLVVGMETGGRWSEQAYSFLELLAWDRAQGVSPALQRPTALAWLRRWTSMVSVATMCSFAETLLYGGAQLAETPYTGTPDLGALLDEVKYARG